MASKGRLLIVGADDAVTMLLGHYLESLGYELAFAADAIEALGTVPRLSPEVILDQRAGWHDGEPVIDTLRKAGSELPVIAIVQEQDKAEAEKAGATVLVRPASRPAISEAVARSLATSRAAMLSAVAPTQAPGGGGVKQSVQPDSRETTADRVGRYEVQALLGRGRMGNVFRCWDPNLERVVAVKTIRHEASDDPKLAELTIERFRREAAASARLQHPGIVATYDFGVDERTGELYLAMELVEGRSLRSVLFEGAFQPDEAVRLGWQLADALAHAHERNVVHRDVKPENVAVNEAGRAKIMDFGIARIDATTISEGQVIAGTPSYMAPEQVLGHEIDGRTDQFALGALMHELLTGKMCFTAEDVAARLLSVLAVRPPLLADLGVHVPPELQEMINRMLAKGRKDRYSTDAELIAAFGRVGQVLGLRLERAEI